MNADGRNAPELLLFRKNGRTEIAQVTQGAVNGVRTQVDGPGEEFGQHLEDPTYATVAGCLMAGWELEERTPTRPRPRVWRRVAQTVDYVLNAERVPGHVGDLV